MAECLYLLTFVTYISSTKQEMLSNKFTNHELKLIIINYINSLSGVEKSVTYGCAIH